MENSWTIKRSGSEIRLLNSWLGGSKLYIDGDLKDFNQSKLASSRHVFMSGSFINASGEREVIEVFAKSKLISVGFLITANGEEIFREGY
jgi:hypothetical protein